MKIGEKVPVRTGEIVNIVEYPELKLTYYGVKFYEPWSKKFDIVYIEKKQLKKLQEPNNYEGYSQTHTHSHVLGTQECKVCKKDFSKDTTITPWGAVHSPEVCSPCLLKNRKS